MKNVKAFVAPYLPLLGLAAYALGALDPAIGAAHRMLSPLAPAWEVVKRPLLLLWLVHYTWVIFAAVMNSKRVERLGVLTRAQRIMTYGALAIGYPLDYFCMLLWSFILLDLPQELTLSGKLWRLSHLADDAGRFRAWQKRRAIYWRTRFLDNEDPDGEHRG